MNIIPGFKLCRKGLHQYSADLKCCPECQRETRRRWREKNPDRQKEYDRRWYKQNAERCSKNNKQWRERNIDRHKENKRRWYERNAEQEKKNQRQWREQNREKINAIRVKRRAAQKQAIADWVKLDAIKQIYLKAAKLTKLTGIPQQVDHIYPLQSDYMCGFHVENNLQIITSAENQSKGNRTWPGQLDCQKGSVYDIFSKELTDLLND